jgi:hypothetical protein
MRQQVSSPSSSLLRSLVIVVFFCSCLVESRPKHYYNPLFYPYVWRHYHSKRLINPWGIGHRSPNKHFMKGRIS